MVWPKGWGSIDQVVLRANSPLFSWGSIKRLTYDTYHVSCVSLCSFAAHVFSDFSLFTSHLPARAQILFHHHHLYHLLAFGVPKLPHIRMGVVNDGLCLVGV